MSVTGVLNLYSMKDWIWDPRDWWARSGREWKSPMESRSKAFIVLV